MAASFLSYVAADLTLGKPALFWLPTTASVRDALRALKCLEGDASEISIWECVCGGGGGGCGGGGDDGFAGTRGCDNPPSHVVGAALLCEEWCCQCVGKVCMPKVLCYLASQESLCNLVEALDEPVTALLSDEYPDPSVQHVNPETSLQEVLQLIAAGVQNLIVPITKCAGTFSKGCNKKIPSAIKNGSAFLQRSHGGQLYCWLTLENVLRFFLGSIGAFSSLSMMSIQDLGIIRTDIHIVGTDEKVASALEMVKEACSEVSAVAVVEEDEDMPGAYRLMGDISSTTLQGCNETVALALATLSAGDFVLYGQQCGDSTDYLLNLIQTQLHEKVGESINDGYRNVELLKLGRLQQAYDSSEDSSSEGEESGAESPTGPHGFPRKWLSTHYRASNRTSFSIKNRSGPIFCNPRSSLVAVLLQALASREHYVWVTREDGTLAGIATFWSILAAVGNHINV